MTDLAFRTWRVLGTVLAILAVWDVMISPQFAGEEWRFAPAAAVFGYVIAAPIAMALARIARGAETGQAI